MSLNWFFRSLIAVVAIALVVVVALVAYNAMNPAAPAAPAATATVEPTMAPTATPAPAATSTPVEQTAEYLALKAMYDEMVASQATATPVAATAAPVVVAATAAPRATAAPAAATAAPQAVARKTIRSSELTLVGYTADNQPFTHAIREADLKKVNYTDVTVEDWDGMTLARNSAGVIVRLWGRESQGKGREAKQPVSVKKAQAFFNSKGHLRADNAREGWFDGKGSALATMELHDIRIVKLEGEAFCRLVVAGQAKKASKPTPAPVVDSNPSHNEDDTTTEDDTTDDEGDGRPAHSDDDTVVRNENGDQPSAGEQLPPKAPAHSDDQAATGTNPGHSDDQGSSKVAAHSDDDAVVRNENGDTKADEAGLPKK